MTPISSAILGIVRALPTATILVSPKGQIHLANSGARELLGLESELSNVALGETVIDPPQKIADYLRACARTTTNIPGTLTARQGDGERVFRCDGALISPRSGDTPALVMVRMEPRGQRDPFILLRQTIEGLNYEIKRRRDVEAALRRSESSLRERAREAEASNRLKDEFLAAVSHELRTPLHAILGWVEILRDASPAPERLTRGLEVIQRNAKHQAHLVDELLDIARIIAGKMRLNVAQLDPVHVIEAAIESVKPALDAKGIRLHAVLDPRAGPILGDAERLQQVVWNLLSNAMKFTPKGGRIQVLLETIDSSVQVTVSDTGQGIAPEFLPYVFDRFRQQESSAARTHGGLGIGLSIAKNLVDLHGGTICVDSEGHGKGASFVIKLPRASVRTTGPSTSAPGAAPGTPTHPPERYLAGLHMLIVDDDVDSAEMLASLFEQYGALTRTCHSAKHALAAFHAVLPDIVVSDIGMPGEDGYSLIQRIRALSRHEGGRTPAIALTAYTRTDDRTRALRAGFQAHIGKPVELNELIAMVGSLTGRIGSWS